MYNGYLIKVGSYIIPLSMIQAETYKATHFGQDLDSYRDTDGVLHRTALSTQAPKVEFETVNMLTDREMSDFLRNIRANYTNEVEKKATVEVYVPELDRYVTNEMYMPDIEFNMYWADSKRIQYTSTRIAFISYGVSTL